MKHLPVILAAGLAIAAANTAVAADKETLFGGTFSGNLKIGTDYVFRGESETNDGEIPMIQGSITWSHPVGLYLGYFAGNNKFPANNPATGYENTDIWAVVGPYVGFAAPIFDTGFNFDIMAFKYQYPGANYNNYSELYMYLSRQFGPVNIKLEVTPTLEDWFGWKGVDGIAYAVHPSVSLPYGFTVSGALGYQELDGDPAAQGWRYWSLGVSKALWGLNFDLRYHDTNVTKTHKVYGYEDGRDLFDARLVLAVSKSF